MSAYEVFVVGAPGEEPGLPGIPAAHREQAEGACYCAVADGASSAYVMRDDGVVVHRFDIRDWQLWRTVPEEQT